jgi:hypothetical protein
MNKSVMCRSRKVSAKYACVLGSSAKVMTMISNLEWKNGILK